MKGIVICLSLMISITYLYGQETKKEAQGDSEKLAQQYLDTFEKTGVPAPTAVEAAFAKATKESTIENWEFAARLANTYANVVDVLRDHYADLYYESKSSYSRGGNTGYLEKAAEYERKRNEYLGKRNEAYLNLADLYLAKGNKSRALSYAMTAVRLSGAYPNTRGENLIKKIIEFQ